jgi:undecaprenyl phosphate N,N'-diacetylbacillosamine 1-phosphate transferase
MMVEKFTFWTNVINMSYRKLFSQIIKIILDKIISVAALVILSPVFLLLAILIKLDSSGPVFFLQERVGKNGVLFQSIKFRTMIDRALERGLGFNIKKDDERITRMGKFLRTWSLDELPQIINVIKGDMSIVGPRPTLPYQVELYNDFQRCRLLVKPGITGWAQVNGRNAISWEQRIKLDVWYVKNWSLWLDIVILFNTIRVVIRKEGLYGTGGVNDDFLSSKNDTTSSMKST